MFRLIARLPPPRYAQGRLPTSPHSDVSPQSVNKVPTYLPTLVGWHWSLTILCYVMLCYVCRCQSTDLQSLRSTVRLAGAVGRAGSWGRAWPACHLTDFSTPRACERWGGALEAGLRAGPLVDTCVSWGHWLESCSSVRSCVYRTFRDR